jgi:putative peptide zinc metalloprotease protein
VPAPAPTPTAVAPSAPVEERPRAQWAIVLVPHGTADTTEVAIGTATVPTGERPGPGEETDPPIAPTEPEPAPPPPDPGEEPAPTSAPSQPAETSRPEWPFPFEPPREPEEGDNQARAVNTQDGSTKVDVALALVWVTDGSPVEQRNEAYALASCRDCRTVAIAFQVVFVIGYAQVVTPINAAVALNYACEACTTHALAVQLVATLTREPSPETLGELAEIWAQLEEDSESFALLPIEQVYEDLLETRTRLLEVIAGEGAESPTETEPEPEAVEPVTGADAADVADATPPAATDDAEPSPEEPTTTPEPPPADAEPGAAEPDAATESSQEAPSTTDGTTTSSESTSTTDEQADSPPPPAETTTEPSETEAPPTTP